MIQNGHHHPATPRPGPPAEIWLSRSTLQVFERVVGESPVTVQRLQGLLEGLGADEVPYNLEITAARLVLPRDNRPPLPDAPAPTDPARETEEVAGHGAG